MMNYKLKPNNIALFTDLYQLTMMQGYYFSAPHTRATFDYFFRKSPFKGGYGVFAGLGPLLSLLENLTFTPDDLDYLRQLDTFHPEFLDYLKNFRFQGTIYAVSEGEIVFPHEPLLRIEANLLEAQLIETLLLNLLNFQTLIATKTARIALAAEGKSVLEFGARRAQGFDGGLSASRAAFIGGAGATSNLLAGKEFGIPVKGTMAHSWIMSYLSELEAFEEYAKIYPQNAIFLVDTYDTLKSGIPNAITCMKKLKEKGIHHFGIRLDSGDLEYLSKASRAMLDEAELPEAFIVASNDLDEYIITELLRQKAPIDFFGVGTKLITAHGDSALTGVYKLSAKEREIHWEPCIKVSNNPEKTTNPGRKNILRFSLHNSIQADLLYLEDEAPNLLSLIDKKSPITLIHPERPYEKFILSDYTSTRVLLKPVMKEGKITAALPNIEEIQEKTRQNLHALHESHKRLLNPHLYKISLSETLSQLKLEMISQYH